MTALVARADESRLAHHLDDALGAIAGLHAQLPRVLGWSEQLRRCLDGGGRLLVAGNGGSAALAQHLTSELVGRFDGERRAYSALCLSAESSSLTAIGNDYGFEHAFARQIQAHGRAGDILLALSTSGRSANLLQASVEAHRLDLTVWAMTGPLPNPLGIEANEVLDVDARSAAAVQEAQQVAVHLLCRAFDAAVQRQPAQRAHGNDPDAISRVLTELADQDGEGKPVER
jgi:D-sedoheptulose 7-phosphate isomerase